MFECLVHHRRSAVYSRASRITDFAQHDQQLTRNWTSHADSSEMANFGQQLPVSTGAPFKDWNLPASLTRLRERLAKHSDGDRQFVDVLSMVGLYGLEAVTEACAAALEEQVASSEYVVNLLHRAAAPARAPLLQVPEALKLAVEPAANCDRYDQLLRSRPALNVIPVHHSPLETYANATDRTTQIPAPARHGECAGGEPDGSEPEEARPNQLAGAAAAGGSG